MPDASPAASTPEDSAASFYERLAPDYHLIFAAWPASVRRPGAALDGFIRARLDAPPGSLLDCSLWEWDLDTPSYTLRLFILEEADGEWRTTHASTRYRALLRGELDSILHGAGFTDIRWHSPEESGYYQPIVTARK